MLLVRLTYLKSGLNICSEMKLGFLWATDAMMLNTAENGIAKMTSMIFVMMLRSR